MKNSLKLSNLSNEDKELLLKELEKRKAKNAKQSKPVKQSYLPPWFERDEKGTIRIVREDGNVPDDTEMFDGGFY